MRTIRIFTGSESLFVASDEKNETVVSQKSFSFVEVLSHFCSSCSNFENCHVST